MDEAGSLNKEKLEQNTAPAKRGSKKAVFESSPLFLSTYMVGSTPLTLAGRWFIEQEKLSITDPDSIIFIRANAVWNQHNLGEGWLKNQKRTTLPWIYRAEYLNIRPSITENMFYFLLNEEKHGYSNYNYSYLNAIGQSVDCRADADLELTEPLLLGADWGAAINSCVVAQSIGREFRVLKNLYVLGINQEDQNDLYANFDKYYGHKKNFNNLIYLFYDQTGNLATGFTKLTRAQQVKAQLEAKGWRVILMTSGRTNPQHERKFRLYEMIMGENNPTFPLFRINVHNCRELLIAMQNAKAYERSETTGIKKDKSSERMSGEARVYATDLTDALDAVFFQKFSYLLSNPGILLPPSSIHS